jgi:hypothetical protein
MTIFEVGGSRLSKLAEVETRSSNDWSHVQFSRELDLAKTRAAAGKTALAILISAIPGLAADTVEWGKRCTNRSAG